MNSQSLRRFTLLFVDGDPAATASLRCLFHSEPFEIVTAATGAAALRIMENTPVDAALIQLKMPEMSGMELLAKIHAAWPTVSVIMLTGHGGIAEAVQAIKSGAVDFLVRPFEPGSLQARVRQLYHIWRLEEENRRLKEQVQAGLGFDQLIGNAPAMLLLKRMIFQVSASDANILIQGEAGTGKELVARAIHHHSARREAPFVTVDCSGLGETGIESELFGHLRGTLPGAHETKPGSIRSADRGTLLLNEVGELSPAMQAKLLRSIREKEVRPIGASRSFPVRVRFLTATRGDLQAQVAQGRFQQELYYHLNVVSLKVPPLRERFEDIAVLARYFINRFQTPASPVRTISVQALAVLTSYGWPGNVRELEHLMRRAVALGRHEEIGPADLPANLGGDPAGGPEPAQSDRMQAYELTAIRNALAKCAGHRQKTARLLGIGEATLYRKLLKYRLS